MTTAEKEYAWIRNLSDTANGKLNGKAKIELETYIQMAYFDRISAQSQPPSYDDEQRAV